MTYEEHLATIQQKNPEVLPELQQSSARALAGLDQLHTGLHGVVLVIKDTSYGQPRPYADWQHEGLLFCYRPNAWTTGSPAEDQARLVVGMLTGGWTADCILQLALSLQEDLLDGIDAVRSQQRGVAC